MRESCNDSVKCVFIQYLRSLRTQRVLMHKIIPINAPAAPSPSAPGLVKVIFLSTIRISTPPEPCAPGWGGIKGLSLCDVIELSSVGEISSYFHTQIPSYKLTPFTKNNHHFGSPQYKPPLLLGLTSLFTRCSDEE